MKIEKIYFGTIVITSLRISFNKSLCESVDTGLPLFNKQ